MQEENDLKSRVDQQIAFALNDIDGAIRYILEGENEHPNRIDICKGRATESNVATSQQNQSTFGTGQQTRSTFGQPSAFGTNMSRSGSGVPNFSLTSAPGQQPNSVSQPSSLGQPASGFGQPSMLGQGSSFGQPSTLGQGSSFGQPSTLGQNSSFGRPSQIGNQTSAFGKPSSLGQQPAFGRPAFGQPAFAQPAFGRPAFGQPSFGQPSAPQQSSAFSRPTQSQSTVSPFAQNGLSGQRESPFAQVQGNGRGQMPTATRNPFQPNAQNSAQGTAAPEMSMEDDQMQDGAVNQPSHNKGFGQVNSSQPLVNGFSSTHTNGTYNDAKPNYQDPSNYSTKDGSGRLRAWKGQPVVYDGAGVFYRRADNRSLERIWFPDGPPQGRNQTEAPPEAYAEKQEELEEQYQYLRDNDAFKGGIMPEEAPLLVWRRYDL